jgi:nicotinamide mononucleotide transporter
MSGSVLTWLSDNWPELAGSLLGLVAVYFQYRQKPALWPVSILVAILYTYVFITSGLYAYTLLQIYYFAISIYGWHLWVKKKDDCNGIKVTRTDYHMAFILLLISAALFAGLYFLLLLYTDSDVPFTDAFVTALSFVATWMLARKKLENWLVWIVADAVSVGLYLYKELYATAIFYSVLTLVAIAGYFKWKKSITAS